MGKTNFDDVELEDANQEAEGRGNLTDQLGRIKADLDSIQALINELKGDFESTLTKLDSDSGTSDSDYATANSVTESDVSVTAV